MRYRERRSMGARTGHGAARAVLPPLAAICLAVAARSLYAVDDAPSPAPGGWVLRALAADSACVVLADGRDQRRVCIGETVAAGEPRLVHVDAASAMFEIDAGLTAPLSIRVVQGEVINVPILREAMRDAVAARPGWIETERKSPSAAAKDRTP